MQRLTKKRLDTLESARAMAQVEKEVGIVTGVGFTYRRNAALAEIAKLVTEGHLGEINHFDGRYWCDYGVDPSTPMAWRYKGPIGAFCSIKIYRDSSIIFLCF